MPYHAHRLTDNESARAVVVTDPEFDSGADTVHFRGGVIKPGHAWTFVEDENVPEGAILGRVVKGRPFRAPVGPTQGRVEGSNTMTELIISHEEGEWSFTSNRLLGDGGPYSERKDLGRELLQRVGNTLEQGDQVVLMFCGASQGIQYGRTMLMHTLKTLFRQ